MRRVIPDRHAGSEFPGFPEQSGDYFLRVAHTMRRVIPDRRTWSELLRLPRTARRVSRTVQTNAASSPLTATQETSFLLLSRTVRRVSTTATQGASHPSCFPDRKAVRRVVLRPPLRERVPTASPTSTASFPNCPNQCGESSRIVPTSAASPPRPPRRERASLAFPNCPTNAASRPPTAKQCGELLRLSRTVQTNAASRPGLYQPVRRVIPRKSRSSPNCAQNKNSSQHSPSVMRVSKYNGLRAHTHASTRRLCRPCLCFFIIFINIILFYYWVTNRDFIDLFCHTPKT